MDLAEWEVQSASLNQVAPEDLVPFHAVARAVALAMDDDLVRGALLRSMRASKYNENKLVLQDFLERAESLPIRDKVGADGVLKRLVDALPIDVDFYAPSQEQRRTWTGSDNFLVAAIGDPDADRALAFGPDGSSQIIMSADVGVDIVFVIHPAEYKKEYTNRDSGDGDRIEDPPGPALFQQCNGEEWCSGGGGGSPPPPLSTGTYHNQIFPCFNDGPFGGNLELYFHVWDDYGYNSTTATYSDVIPESWNYLRVKLSTFNASASHPLTVHVWEDDLPIMGGDDDKGEASVNGARNYPSIDIYTANPLVGCDGSLPYSVIWANYQIILGEE